MLKLFFTYVTIKLYMPIKFCNKYSCSGEIVATLSLVVLFFISIGSFVGYNLNSNLSQSTITKAKSCSCVGAKSSCGEPCTCNCNCNREDRVTGKDGQTYKVGLQCNVVKGICVPDTDWQYESAKVQNPAYCPNYSSNNNQRRKPKGSDCEMPSECQSGLTCKCFIQGTSKGKCLALDDSCTSVSPTRSGIYNIPTFDARTVTVNPSQRMFEPMTPGQSTPGSCQYSATAQVKFTGVNASSKKSSFSTSSSINVQPPIESTNTFDGTSFSNMPEDTEATFQTRPWETQNMQYNGKTASITLNTPSDIEVSKVYCRVSPVSDTCSRLQYSADQKTISNLPLRCGETLTYGWETTDYSVNNGSPGQGGTPAPTYTDYAEGDNSDLFDKRGGRCQAEFRYRGDPNVDTLIIQEVNGSGVFDLSTVDADIAEGYPQSPGKKRPVGINIYRSSGNCWNVFINWDVPANLKSGKYGSGIGIYLRIEPSCGLQSYTFKYRADRLPDFIKQGKQAKLVFRYSLSPSMQGRFGYRNAQQTQIAEPCPGEGQTGTPTPPVVTNTGTPTPPVVTNTGTPTPPVVTNTGTPTPPVVTNTGTPTPPPCNAKINFLVDASGTSRQQVGGGVTKLQETMNSIKDAVNKYVQDNPQNRDSLKFRDSYFWLTTQGASEYKIASEFNPNPPRNQYWTNIRRALDEQTKNDEYTLFFSDGIPSIVEKGGIGSTCVFPNGNIMSVMPNGVGADTKTNQCNANGNTGNTEQGDECARKCFQDTYQTAFEYARSGPKHGKIISITMDSGQYNDAFMNSVATDGHYRLSSGGYENVLTTIFNQVCRPQENPQNQPVNESFGYTYFIYNETKDEQIESTTFNLCDENNKCISQVDTNKIDPQSDYGNKSKFKTNDDFEINSNKTYTLNCKVDYSDGTTSNCSDSFKFNGNEGARFKLYANKEETASIGKSLVESVDYFKDGTVNTLDYIQFLARMKDTNNTFMNTDYDLTFGDDINSLDLSIILENLGKSYTQ